MRSSAIFYLAVLVSAVYGLPRFKFDDHCKQNPENGRINNPDIRVTDYDVDMTCKNGSFSWNYPLGTIILHFQGKTSFSVCFRDELGADHLEISDVTEGADRRFPAFHRYDRGYLMTGIFVQQEMLTRPEHDINFGFCEGQLNLEHCVQSMNKHMAIRMHSPTWTYMASVLYRLK